jgi:hypothetical protein
MDASHILALADCLTENEETILGPSDSRLAAAALRIVAGNDALMKLIAANGADLRPDIAVRVDATAAGGA